MYCFICLYLPTYEIRAGWLLADSYPREGCNNILCVFRVTYDWFCHILQFLCFPTSRGRYFSVCNWLVTWASRCNYETLWIFKLPQLSISRQNAYIICAVLRSIGNILSIHIYLEIFSIYLVCRPRAHYNRQAGWGAAHKCVWVGGAKMVGNYIHIEDLIMSKRQRPARTALLTCGVRL